MQTEWLACDATLTASSSKSEGGSVDWVHELVRLNAEFLVQKLTSVVAKRASSNVAYQFEESRLQGT